ncbi:hypothetical protein BON30_14000 [Cystobacter ferrugineus]|uniref:Uncharacterized protein n=1 Tax=Cystobacter ferrugineus TaxID=83449 RepID=A0A1L9BD39_9BACT|nr:hypothetical protein BON30_14000 [Cystobacter ferrugineus]
MASFLLMDMATPLSPGFAHALRRPSFRKQFRLSFFFPDPWPCALVEQLSLAGQQFEFFFPGFQRLRRALHQCRGS